MGSSIGTLKGPRTGPSPRSTRSVPDQGTPPVLPEGRTGDAPAPAGRSTGADAVHIRSRSDHHRHPQGRALNSPDGCSLLAPRAPSRAHGGIRGAAHRGWGAAPHWPRAGAVGCAEFDFVRRGATGLGALPSPPPRRTRSADSTRARRPPAGTGLANAFAHGGPAVRFGAFASPCSSPLEIALPEGRCHPPGRSAPGGEGDLAPSRAHRTSVAGSTGQHRAHGYDRRRGSSVAGGHLGSELLAGSLGSRRRHLQGRWDGIRGGASSGHNRHHCVLGARCHHRPAAAPAAGWVPATNTAPGAPTQDGHQGVAGTWEQQPIPQREQQQEAHRRGADHGHERHHPYREEGHQHQDPPRALPKERGAPEGQGTAQAPSSPRGPMTAVRRLRRRRGRSPPGQGLHTPLAGAVDDVARRGRAVAPPTSFPQRDPTNP